MEIDSVRTASRTPAIVLLKEKEGSLYLAIGVGPAEATAIAVRLEAIQAPRPLTHNLLNSMISHLGGRVIHIVITDLLADTFYAKIIVSKDGDLLKVDSRPSDAVALALWAEVPVYADESMLEKAGFVLKSLNGESEDVPRGE